MAPSVGIIITVSVLVAASLAAYENPQVRAWIDRTRHKIAMSLHSLGDEIHPRSRPRRSSTDASMHEEKGELAEERRRQAIAEIMERGRIMEERRKRRKLSSQEKPLSPTFDTVVDDNGILLHCGEDTAARSSGIDASGQPESLRQRTGGSIPGQSPSILHQSIDDSLPSRRLDQLQIHQDDLDNPFESRYEQEMREAWNIPLSDRRIEISSSHASESLIEFTPTTESAPDPDFSIPSAEHLHRPMQQSEYFSAAASNSTHTFSDHGSHSSLPGQDTYSGLPREAMNYPVPDARATVSLTPSVDGSVSDIHASEVGDSTDDVLSEIGDGIRTPASVWTEVGSAVSSDFNM